MWMGLALEQMCPGGVGVRSLVPVLSRHILSQVYPGHPFVSLGFGVVLLYKFLICKALTSLLSTCTVTSLRQALPLV